MFSLNIILSLSRHLLFWAIIILYLMWLSNKLKLKGQFGLLKLFFQKRKSKPLNYSSLHSTIIVVSKKYFCSMLFIILEFQQSINYFISILSLSSLIVTISLSFITSISQPYNGLFNKSNGNFGFHSSFFIFFQKLIIKIFS